MGVARGFYFYFSGEVFLLSGDNNGIFFGIAHGRLPNSSSPLKEKGPPTHTPTHSV